MALLLHDKFADNELPLWAWVTLVLAVDVAHVYATLFRTYFNKAALQRHKALLIAIPAACWVVGVLLYSVDALWFWRTLAYLAVFHFIRQQYGFMCLYSRKDSQSFPVDSTCANTPENVAGKHVSTGFWLSRLDGLAIYTATIYPLIYWHTSLPRNFNWFVEGDFLESLPADAGRVGLVLYAFILLAYFAKEILLAVKTQYFNIPKNLIIAGTAGSWWVGIVMLNSDIAFTMTNVLTHGIPYMALIWLYQKRSSPHAAGAINSPAPELTANSGVKKNFLEDFCSVARNCAPLFVATLLLFAYFEEGLWDALIWREHGAIFAPFSWLQSLSDTPLLALVIPLLSLPQSTHYVLDGFIWRVKEKNSLWTA